MVEIECPTCETRFTVTRKLKEGDRLECPRCGEMFRVTATDPLEITYWDEEQDENDEYEDSLEELARTGDEAWSGFPEDEENPEFELPEQSPLFGEEEEQDQSPDHGPEDN